MTMREITNTNKALIIFSVFQNGLSVSDNDANHESLRDEYSSIMGNVQVMYNGYDGSHQVDVAVMLNVSDAPYHRGYDDLFESTIRFKTVRELKEKLNSLLPKVNDFLGSIELD